MLVVIAGLILPLFVALLCTAPLWLLRAARGQLFGVRSSDMSIWRAIGDFSIVFSVLVALANIAELYRPLAECFSIAMGHKCDLPGSDLLFVWGFFFQVATLPLGIPLAAFACFEVVRRLFRGAVRDA
jgi:hypothetical protein